MSNRINKPVRPSRTSRWKNYAQRGAELAALGAAQFVPGLDVAADAAVAGEAAEGTAVAGEAAEGATMASKGSKSSMFNRYRKKFFKSYLNSARNSMNQGISQPGPPQTTTYPGPPQTTTYPGPPQTTTYPGPPQLPYRSQRYQPPYRSRRYQPPVYQAPVYQAPVYQPVIPTQIGYGYSEPYYHPYYQDRNRQILGPVEKKVLFYALIFIIIAIVVVIVLRVATNQIEGYYHSSSGFHCKKHNNCGSGKKHQSNGGSGQGSAGGGSGHNSCGGS